MEVESAEGSRAGGSSVTYIEPSSCYIAGPMTKIEEFNFPTFDAAARWLRKRGWNVVSPAELDRAAGFDEKGCTGHEVLSLKMRQEFARRDLDAILNVETMFLLPGWEGSTGACHEKKVAEWLGHSVYELKRNGVGAWSAEPLDEPAEAWSGTAEKSTEDVVYDALMPEEYAEPPYKVPPDAWTGVAGMMPDDLNPRKQLLTEADNLVNGDRNVQYGDPNEDFTRTAALWSAWKGVTFEAWEVAVFQDLLKTSRLKWNPGKFDTWVDKAGYSACGWDTVTSMPEAA